MRKRFPLITLWIVCLFTLIHTTQAQRIRNFSFRDINNNVQSLEDIKGEKITILDFWTTWCKPCRKAIPKLNMIYEQYKDQGVGVVGMNCDGPRSIAKVAPMSASLQIEYPVLLDIDAEIFNELNLSGYPTLIILDSSNKVKFIHEGFVTGDEQEIIEQVEKLLAK